MISVNSESFGILQKLNDNNKLFMPRPSYFFNPDVGSKYIWLNIYIWTTYRERS